MIRTLVKCALVCIVLQITTTAQNSPRSSNGEPTTSTERICLTQVLIETQGSDTPAQIVAARSKAEQVRNALRLGGSWADLARTDLTGLPVLEVKGLGCLQRNDLAPPTAGMKVGDVSDVLNTKLGFAVLQVWGEDPQIESATRQPVLESGLRGRVVGTVDHTAISGAYVVVHRDGAADAHVRTDSNGTYAMPLPVGVYDVFISADGFSPASRKIRVSTDTVMVYDAVLEFNTLGMQFEATVR